MCQDETHAQIMLMLTNRDDLQEDDHVLEAGLALIDVQHHLEEGAEDALARDPDLAHAIARIRNNPFLARLEDL